ncbi:MAG: aminotransferase class V-fold PLP-dependent enzyme [Gemmatimonadaceae bacterium]|nr:aminotransferase class V-fold PLP-dependent enzyme [Gemmatimonadaceae bacterium]
MNGPAIPMTIAPDETRATTQAAFATLDAVAAREFPRVRRPGIAFLNNASTGPLPESALRALADFNAMRAEPWTITQEFQFGTVARSRELLARLVGAAPTEIALMTNTSYGLNLAARALDLRERDVVVTSDREFPSNIYTWMALARARGVVFDRIPCVGRLADEAAILAALDRPGVRVLVLSWVSFETGYTLDLARLGRACRERGITFVVDAIQGLGALTLDLSSLDVDILACGCQKWLVSPWGTGFVYVRQGLVTQLEPSDVGWMSVQGSDDFTRMLDYRFTYRDDARRFEVVTLPFQEFAALNAALDLFFEVGPSVAAARIARHVAHLYDWAAAHARVQLVSSSEPARRSGIVALVPPDPSRASAALSAAGVAHSLREGAIRLSPHWFTPGEHVTYALDVLERATDRA